jgi:hypothetical protein
MFRALLLIAVSAWLRAAAPCAKPYGLTPGVTLDNLAASSLGDTRYSISIALATNARTADGFSYIANPDDLHNVSRVCVPSKSEARELLESWELYRRAIDEARLPRAAALDKDLVSIPPDKPVELVAWMRKDQADRLKGPSGEWIQAAPSDTWVTVEPYLREFCRRFGQDRKADEAKLTQRLEQRLGLSPSSSKTNFVRLRLQQPWADAIFRPCSDPAADHPACMTGPPSSSSPDYLQWFLQQYYSSYGQTLIGEFPWTALGYTFDWALGEDKQHPFQRYGESEFVVRKNAPIEILEVLTTAQYCGLGPR